MPIRYIKGDATRPQGEGNKIIVHICNDVGAWGAGFVLALSKRWSEPEAAYRDWHDGLYPGPFKLGEIQTIQVEEDIRVCNLIGQRGFMETRSAPPIRYEAIKSGLGKLWHLAGGLNASIHMPRIGCGLAGGTWDRVEPIIAEELAGLSVTVYDL